MKDDTLVFSSKQITSLPDFETTKDSIIDYMLFLCNFEPKNIDDRKEIISNMAKLTYNYMTHIQNEQGKSMPDIEYYYSDRDSEYYGFASDSQITICKEIFLKQLKNNLAAELLDSLFHESTHICDDFDESIRAKTPKKICYQYPGTEDGETVDDFKLYLSMNHPELDQEYIEDLGDDIWQRFYSIYNNTYSESRAFSFGQTTTKNLVSEAIESGKYQRVELSKLELLSMTIDDIFAWFKEGFDYANDIVLSPNDISLIVEYKEHLLNDITNAENSMKEAVANNKKVDRYRYQNLYENKINRFSTTCILLDDYSNMPEVLDSAIDLVNNKIVKSNEVFSAFIVATDFAPSMEQFERVAKCYKSANFDKDYTNLTYYLGNFSAVYDIEFLLDLYSLDNPDFLDELDNFHSETDSIPDELKSKYIKQYKAAEPADKNQTPDDVSELAE